MRLEKSGHEHKVWLTDDEVEALRRACPSARDDLIIQLGAYVGLRSFEVPQVTPGHVKRSDGEHCRLRVPEGKDTRGDREGGKPHDEYLPDRIERALFRYQRDEELDDDEPYVDLTPRGVRAAVDRATEAAADRTGDDDFLEVPSHDLRRRFAQRLLVDEAMNPCVVMAVGGSSSFEAIKPYLNTPSEGVVNQAFDGVKI